MWKTEASLIVDFLEGRGGEWDLRLLNRCRSSGGLKSAQARASSAGSYEERRWLSDLGRHR